MKKKILIVSIVSLIVLSVAGSTFAWYTASDNNYSNNLIRNKDRIVGLSVISIETLQTGNSIEVKNQGNTNIYVRIRLIPQWNDPSISISNVELNLSLGEGWTGLQSDGYYYYTKPISNYNKTSIISYNSQLIDKENKTTLDGFKLKVVSEGVQTHKQAIKSVWNINSIPSN